MRDGTVHQPGDDVEQAPDLVLRQRGATQHGQLGWRQQRGRAPPGDGPEETARLLRLHRLEADLARFNLGKFGLVLGFGRLERERRIEERLEGQVGDVVARRLLVRHQLHTVDGGDLAKLGLHRVGVQLGRAFHLQPQTVQWFRLDCAGSGMSEESVTDTLEEAFFLHLQLTWKQSRP